MGMTDDPGRSRRARGGGAGRARVPAPAIAQMPWRLPVNPDRPTEPLDPDGLQRIHRAAMRILSEIGIEFPNPEATAILKRAGCIVSGTNVRMDAAFVMEMLAQAPPQFAITPRNPAHRITMGGDVMLFGNVSSSPNVWDLERGKRAGDRESYRDFVRLTQYFNCIHFFGGYPVEPADIAPAIRHLDCMQDALTLSDKAVHVYTLGAERIEDAMEMVRLAAGLDHDEFDAAPRLFTNINSASPLKHDFAMLDGAMRLARRGQPVVVTPFTLAGATAPAGMAGAVALSLAEALSAVALLQYVRPGCPVAIGTFTTGIDARTGAPSFGTPEAMRATQMTGQLVRFYGLPLRSSGACSANVPDGQAMWESANSLWAAVQSRANMVYHAAGWLEGGLVASPEKFVMDCEVLQIIQRYFEQAVFATTDDDIAIEAIRAAGAQGHWFGSQTPKAGGAAPFHTPFASDWRSYEAWHLDGAVWTAERAHGIYKRILADFTPPPMPDADREALERFVAHRKQEGGASVDG